MAGKVNKNEQPLKRLSDIKPDVRWSQYQDGNHFCHLCALTPDREEEALRAAEIVDEEQWRRKGLVYVMVVEDRILKIGQSINTFASRLGSYNTGKMAYRSRGTNSGANFFILQSLINIGKDVDVYGYFPEHRTWEILGVKGEEPFPPAKVVEGIFIRRFVDKYGVKPIGCGQQ